MSVVLYIKQNYKYLCKYKDLFVFKQKENSQKKMDMQTSRYEICDMKGGETMEWNWREVLEGRRKRKK